MSSQTDPTTVLGRAVLGRRTGGRSGLHLRIQYTTESVAVKISPQARLATEARSQLFTEHPGALAYSLIIGRFIAPGGVNWEPTQSSRTRLRLIQRVDDQLPALPEPPLPERTDMDLPHQ
jgi:hypothetical protein